MGGFLSELIFKITGDPAPLKEALDQSAANVSAATEKMVTESAAAAKVIAGHAKEEADAFNEAAAAAAGEIGDEEEAFEEFSTKFRQAMNLNRSSVQGARSELQKMQDEAARLTEQLNVMKANPELVASIRAAKNEMKALGEAGAGSLTETRLQAQLLSNELGLRLPRAVTTLISHSDVLAGALKAAFPLLLIGFAIQEVERLSVAIGKAMANAVGYTKEVQKQYEADVKANEEALRHFSTVQEGQERIAETTKRLGEVSKVTFEENMSKSANDAAHSLWNLIGPVGTLIAAYNNLGDAVAKAADEQVLLNNRLRAQQGEIVHVAEVEAHHQLKMAEGNLKADEAGKKRADQLKLEIGFLDHKRDLQIQIAKQEAAQEALRRGGAGGYAEDVARRTSEINQEIDLEKKRLEGDLAGIHLKVAAAKDYAAEIERQNTLLREQTELEKAGETGPETSAIMQAERQIAAEQKVVQEAEKAYKQKKITREQMQATEKAYADFVVTVNEALALKIEGIETKLDDELLRKRQELARAEEEFTKKVDAEQAKIAKSPATAAIAADLAAISLGFKNVTIDVHKFAADYDTKTGEMKVKTEGWKKSVAEALHIHPSTVAFISETNQMGISAEKLHQELIRVFRLGLPQELNVSKQALANWANDTKQKITFAQTAWTFYTSTVKSDLQLMNQAVTASAVNALIYGKSVGAAMEAALKSTLASIASEAAVRAIYNLALGFYYEATYQYAQATAAFTAAALFGSVAALAGGAAAAIPGGGTSAAGGGSAPSGGGGSGAGAAGQVGSPVLAPGAAAQQQAALKQATQGPVVIHMEFKGPIYGGQQGLDELASHLTNAVLTRDVKLVGSHTVNPVPVSRGRS